MTANYRVSTVEPLSSRDFAPVEIPEFNSSDVSKSNYIDITREIGEPVVVRNGDYFKQVQAVLHIRVQYFCPLETISVEAYRKTSEQYLNGYGQPEGKIVNFLRVSNENKRFIAHKVADYRNIKKSVAKVANEFSSLVNDEELMNWAHEELSNVF